MNRGRPRVCQCSGACPAAGWHGAWAISMVSAERLMDARRSPAPREDWPLGTERRRREGCEVESLMAVWSATDAPAALPSGGAASSGVLSKAPTTISGWRLKRGSSACMSSSCQWPAQELSLDTARCAQMQTKRVAWAQGRKILRMYARSPGPAWQCCLALLLLELQRAAKLHRLSQCASSDSYPALP